MSRESLRDRVVKGIVNCMMRRMPNQTNQESEDLIL